MRSLRKEPSADRKKRFDKLLEDFRLFAQEDVRKIPGRANWELEWKIGYYNTPPAYVGMYPLDFDVSGGISPYGVKFELVNKSAYYPVRVIYFGLAQLPGCCGVGVSFHGYHYLGTRKGVGEKAQKLRINLARELGFTILLATDRLDDNHKASRRIFEKNGWTELTRFTNRRTEALVGLQMISLMDGEIEEEEEDDDYE